MLTPGRSLHLEHVQDTTTLVDKLASEHWDLVLSRDRVNGTCLADVVTTAGELRDDVPVIGVSHSPTRSEVARAMRLGARDLVSLHSCDHLHLVIDREIRAMRERRYRRAVESRHREFQRQTFALLNTISDPILIIHQSKVTHANPPALRLCGYWEMSVIRGRPFASLVSDEDRPRIESFLARLVGGSRMQRVRMSLQPRIGPPIEATVTFSRTTFSGRRSVLAMIGAETPTEDRTGSPNSLARRDPRTRLHTPESFLNALSDAIERARTDGVGSALILVELENFRAMRQSVGLVGTDRLVKDLTAVVADGAGDARAVGRFANHTFALLLRGCDSTFAASRAEALRARVEGHTSEVAGRSVATTCTLAVVPITPSCADREELMKTAERLCRDGVSAGGNRVVQVTEIGDRKDIGQPRRHRSALVHEGRLSVVWQPIVHLHGGQDESFELTIGSHDDGDGFLGATQLYEVTDCTQHINLDCWLLEQAVASKRDQEIEGHDVHYFVRLSPAAVTNESVLVHLTRLLRSSSVNRHRLTIQIPEICASEQVRSARAFVSASRKLYCSTALDGFGTYLTSIHDVERLGADYVKLGAHHLEGLTRDAGRRQALERLQGRLRQQGIISIANHVDDAGTLMLVWQCGVDYAQGDCIRKPSLELSHDFSQSVDYR
jgi:diguanylate cyclase (GGDEF)-like protein